MAKGESYTDIIFQLGDLARERLANRPNGPRSMDRVFRAEDALAQRREELAQLEEQLNDEDEGYKAYLESQKAERIEQEAIVRKWKRAVDAVEGRTREMRKRLTQQRSQMRGERSGVRKAEARLKDLEMTEPEGSEKVNQAKENLKKIRISFMRRQRQIEETEADLMAILTPKPGQIGAPGLLAHKRLLEMEDETVVRKEDFEDLMADLNDHIGGKEEEVKAAEDYLDQAIFLLGEDCYAQRIPDPELAVFYPRLDQAK